MLNSPAVCRDRHDLGIRPRLGAQERRRHGVPLRLTRRLALLVVAADLEKHGERA